MPIRQRSPTTWIQLLQALVARELVEELGVTATRAAALLGLTPSAVSQYLSGQRMRGPFLEHSTDPGARRIARGVAERLMAASNRPDARIGLLLEGAGVLAGVPSVDRGPAASPLPPSARGGSTSHRSTAKWLRRRVQAEQAAVTMCMHLAQKARDELTRAILRQIAADSLRHAEIVASLAPYLDRGITHATASGVTRREIESLIEGERKAEAGADTVTARDLGGTMSLLIASMEADERKHADLLRGLLDAGFAP